MPTVPTPAQSAASRANGARSRGPTSAAGKAASAKNGTRHGLRGGPFALLPAEDREEFAELHAAVTTDWGPRDAYERRWVMELVTAYWRQDRLRGLELAALTAAAGEEGPPTEVTLKRLVTFARYGARIDRDIAKALQALRALRNRPDDWLDEPQKCTFEPEARLRHRPRGTATTADRTRCDAGRERTLLVAAHVRTRAPGRTGYRGRRRAAPAPEPPPAAPARGPGAAGAALGGVATGYVTGGENS